MKPTHIIAVAGLAVIAAVGCDTRAPAAYGDANSVIVAAPDSLWTAIRDTTLTALEPRIRTVRDERTFQLTHVSPSDENWLDLRKWKQVLVIGPPDAPWLAPVLEEVEGEVPTPPALIEAGEVWAQNQRVTAILLPEGAGREAIVPLLPELHELLDRRFREYARARMFASGLDTALQDTLRRQAGFSLLLPMVYDWAAQDSTYLFQNNYIADSEIRRSVLVTWRSGTAGTPTREDAIEWRQRVNERYYQFPQATVPESVEAERFTEDGHAVLEAQGLWTSPEGSWPAAGPFISRIIDCPEQDRRYFVDAWLYAPGKDKYEYMIQLQTILGTFECGEA